MIEVLLCLNMLMFGGFKERKQAEHHLKLSLNFESARFLYKKYKKDPEMALTLKEVAYYRYCLETRGRFFGGYDSESSQELQDYNFKMDMKED